MKGILAVIATLVVAQATNSHQHNELCHGFIPENDMSIPVGHVFMNGEETGITEQEFNDSIDRVEAIYAPIIEAKGKKLDMKRLWSNSTVNASAQQFGDTWRVNMYGGLARHPSMTVLGFTAVVCHELGHHLAGAPKYGRFNGWASGEGQSDYFATSKCMRKVYSFQEDLDYAVEKEIELEELAVNTCRETFYTYEEEPETPSEGEPEAPSQEEMLAEEGEQAPEEEEKTEPTEKELSIAAFNRCLRNAESGRDLATLLNDLSRGKTAPRFDTPSESVVRRTSNSHPKAQCRLDTYYAGSLCTVDPEVDFDNKDPLVGACNRVDGATTSARPLCWYKPPVVEE